MDAEIQKPVTGEVKYGMEGLKHPTPMWAIWIFRTEFVLNKALLFWLGATNVVRGDAVKETLLIIAAIDLVVWGLARFVGIKKTDFDE